MFLVDIKDEEWASLFESTPISPFEYYFYSLR